MKTFSAAVALLVLAACGDPNQSPGGGGKQYRTVGFVLDEEGRGPELCLGGVADSLPPQCRGVPIAGWEWDAVDDEESRSGATWGTYEVVGGYDGETFTLTDVGPPPETAYEDEPFSAACSEPPGGWFVPDPGRASLADAGRAISAAEREPDSSGGWIHQPGAPSESNSSQVILNLAFTGDLERHEDDARRLWGGPLCVVEYEHTYARLREIQRELSGEVAEELGLEVLGSGVDVEGNAVDLGVVLADDRAQAELDERYGEGTVRLDARLQPVE